MPLKACKTFKVIQNYPLSQVEIVEWRGKQYILKSVPKNWEAQIKRQDFLLKRCKTSLIPDILWIRTIEDRKYFLMDFIQSDAKAIPDEIYIKTLDIFHAETAKVKSKLFPTYDFTSFKQEFIKIKKILPAKLGKQLENRLDDFEAVFQLPTSIVHGDWVHAQLIGSKGKYWIIDFEMSFYGPSILDHAHFFLKEKTGKHILDLLGIDKETFLKARIVESMRKLGWFIWFMENEITTYKFAPEIKEYVGILERLLKE